MKQVELKLIVKEKSLLLEYLLNNIKDKSKNNIKSLLKNRNISVNANTTTKFDYELNKDDIIKIKLVQINNKRDKIDILYEDDYLIIVDKKDGLLTISTEKEKDKTLYHYVSSYVKKDNKKNKIFVVNRLDRETSGIVIFAKDEKTKRLLQDNWDKSVLLRGYVAIVEGVTEDKGIIKSYLKENSNYFVYVTNDKDGKKAVTEYKKIKSNNKYSLLDIKLHTGRKNQIRVQMNEINHPVVGDTKYGAKTNPIKRLCLHSNKLEFIHPVTQKTVKIESSMPSLFNRLF